MQLADGSEQQFDAHMPSSVSSESTCATRRARTRRHAFEALHTKRATHHGSIRIFWEHNGSTSYAATVAAGLVRLVTRVSLRA